MSLAAIIFLALALGIDCLIVSFARGLTLKENWLKNSLLLAITMGFFQWFMPFLGYFTTSGFASHIEPYSKWVIFAIFFVFGVKFILEPDENSEKTDMNLTSLIAAGVGTSIDALASGVSIKLSHTPLLPSTFIIGVTAFLLSLTGSALAKTLKNLPSRFLRFLGGGILIVLALKALI